jgi:hypothetical protein
MRVGRLQHRPNLFVVVVGPSSTARKGTAQREAWKLFEAVDEGFAARNVTSGFGSGQALIDRIADPAKDQRLLIDEQEFAEVLKTADWQNSILGDVLRKAFDSDKPLENQVRHRDSVKSSGHCVSMVGGITPQELSARFTELAASGGFGNRILWVWSDSTKLLPDGGVDYTLDDIAQRISKPRRDYDRTDATVDWWHAHYPQLRDLPHVPEAARQVVRRAPDQTQRIALIYAATEGADAVDVPHMEAGLAWVNYSIETVQLVLGGLVRSRIASKVLASLRNHPGKAVTRTELHDRALRRNYSGPELDAALSELEDARLAHQWVGAGSETGGRKPTFVIATTPEEP